jgi:hypothetical protein
LSGEHSSGLVARRVQAAVFYTSADGKTHEIRVKTAIIAKDGGQIQIEVYPDEEWKQNTIANLLAFRLGSLDLRLPELPLVEAVWKVCNDLKISELAAQTDLHSLRVYLVTLHKRWLVKLSIWLKPLL